jgi:hypothetical protein
VFVLEYEFECKSIIQTWVTQVRGNIFQFGKDGRRELRKRAEKESGEIELVWLIYIKAAALNIILNKYSTTLFISILAISLSGQ